MLAVIAQAADHYGLARISERDIARRLRCGRCAVRMAKVRLERQQCINVVTGTRRPDKRLPTSTFQITVGPWADLWKPPGIARAGAQRTFDKRLDELGPRRDELEEQRARAQTRAQENFERAPSTRAQSARPRKNEVLSQGGARQGALPTEEDYDERERLYQRLLGEDLDAPPPQRAPDPRPLPIGANHDRAKQHIADARAKLKAIPRE